jgi:uncharacterized damage-inducible protein DinB
MTELERFRSLFHQQVLHTFDYLQAINETQWQGIPCDSQALYLGSRINKITIATLSRHLATTESHWISQLPSIPANGTMPMPEKDPVIEAAKTVPGFIDIYELRHRKNMERLTALSAGDLDKPLMFAGRHYTGMGLLWSILGHHAYHLGQMDLLMRQQEVTAPEYMEWREKERVVG